MPPVQQLQEVLPKAGLVVSEKGQLTEVLCKPKILPLKSVTLERIESMEVQCHVGSSPAVAGKCAYLDLQGHAAAHSTCRRELKA